MRERVCVPASRGRNMFRLPRIACPAMWIRTRIWGVKTRVRLFLALLPVALLTLIPGEPWEGNLFSGPTLCVLCGPTPLADAILNIFLFGFDHFF